MSSRAVCVLMILGMAFGTVLMGCGGSEPARMPAKVKKEMSKPKVAELPAWTNGEYAMERAFFGHGEAVMQGDEAAAMETARQAAMKNMALELDLLKRVIKSDHEEQVAEIISRYSPEELNGHVDAAASAAIQEAKMIDKVVDNGRQPNRLFVLYKLPVETFYEKLYAIEALPDEQKTRVKNYHQDFTDFAMKSLSRMEE